MSSQSSAMGGFSKEQEETLALVPAAAERDQISSHSRGLDNPSDASSYLQLAFNEPRRQQTT